MHRHENRIRPDQRDNKVNPAPGLVHHPAKHFGEPVVRSREHAEDSRHAHDEMEMANHKSRVMQRNIEHRLRQKWSAQSPGDEQGNESDGIKHRRLEAHPPAMNPKKPMAIIAYTMALYPKIGLREKVESNCEATPMPGRMAI